MYINFNKQIYVYKRTFVIITLLYSTFLASIKGVSTIINFGLLLWGLWIFLLEYMKNKGVFIKKNKVILVLFLILSVITVALKPNKASNLKILSLTILQFLLLFSYDNYQSKDKVIKEIKRLSNDFIRISLVVSLCSIMMYVLKKNFILRGDEYGITHFNALNGLYTGSNTAGLIACLSIIFSTISLKIPKRNKLLNYINIALQILIILLSKARSALVGILIYFILNFIISMKDKRNKVIVVLSMILFVMIIPVLSKSTGIGESFFIKSEGLGFFSGRLLLWNAGAEVIGKNLLLGVGINNVVNEVRNVATTALPGIEGGGMHNLYIQILISNGAICLILFVAFIIFMTVKLIKALNRSPRNSIENELIKAILCFTIAIYVINMVESSMMYVANFMATNYWIYLGYAKFLTSRSLEGEDDVDGTFS